MTTDNECKPENRLARYFRQGVEVVSVVLFAIMFGAFLFQIFCRYVLNAPLVWTLELCLLSFLWLTFWNCGLLLHLKEHIGFTLIYDAVKPRAQRVLGILGVLLLGGSFLAALPGIIDWTLFMGIDETDVFEIPLDLAFSIFVIFMVAVVIRAILQLRRLTGRNWQAWL
jgi:TRAP-type C4-dicarboxylate transport system permease small subunit